MPHDPIDPTTMMQNHRFRQIVIWVIVIGMILATVASVASLFAS